MLIFVYLAIRLVLTYISYISGTAVAYYFLGSIKKPLDLTEMDYGFILLIALTFTVFDILIKGI